MIKQPLNEQQMRWAWAMCNFLNWSGRTGLLLELENNHSIWVHRGEDVFSVLFKGPGEGNYLAEYQFATENFPDPKLIPGMPDSPKPPRMN